MDSAAGARSCSWSSSCSRHRPFLRPRLRHPGARLFASLLKAGCGKCSHLAARRYGGPQNLFEEEQLASCGLREAPCCESSGSPRDLTRKFCGSFLAQNVPNLSVGTSREDLSLPWTPEDSVPCGWSRWAGVGTSERLWNLFSSAEAGCETAWPNRIKARGRHCLASRDSLDRYYWPESHMNLTSSDRACLGRKY